MTEVKFLFAAERSVFVWDGKLNTRSPKSIAYFGNKEIDKTAGMESAGSGIHGEQSKQCKAERTVVLTGSNLIECVNEDVFRYT